MLLWLVLPIAQADQRTVLRCEPVSNTVISSGLGLFGTQGPWDVWTGTDVDAFFSTAFPNRECLRWGGREHLSWVAPWREEGVLGIEAISKTHFAIGYQGMAWPQIALGGYVLAGVKTHYVHQRVSFPERNIDSDYSSTAFLPSMMLYTTIDFFPRKNMGVHFDISIPLMDYERELYWYNNRLVGIGLSWRR